MIETFMTLVGFSSAIAFGFCTCPQIIKAMRTKKTSDISLLFVCMSIYGNIAAFSYILYTNLKANFYQWPQYLNYSVALSFVIVLLCLKLHYDKKNK